MEDQYCMLKLEISTNKVFSDINTARLFMLYQFKSLRAEMSPYVDKSVYIYDFENAGMNNLALGLFKTLNSELSSMFPNMTYKNILVHPNWIMNMIWGVAKGFLSEHQMKKIQFIQDKDLPDHIPDVVDF